MPAFPPDDDFKQGQVSAGVEIDRQLQAEGWQAVLKDLRSS